MPRYKEPFTIFPRKLKSGRKVYYYRVYDNNGNRCAARSTGQTNKTLAKNYCTNLLSKGLLYSGSSVAFCLYAKDFFADNSMWMHDKRLSSNGKEQAVSINTLKAYRHNNDDILIPYFNETKLRDITPYQIKQFRADMIQKGFSNSAINLACSCLKIILSYALADKLITTDPFTSIKQMYTNAKVKCSFTEQELFKIFHSEWNNSERKIFALTAAVTGMRIGEISAIRRETLFENYIDVKDQLSNGDYIPVKDGEKRKVRICPKVYDMLKSCILRNRGIAFSENQDTYRQFFYTVAGLTSFVRQKRKISFHSLRHFFNTYLITNGISEIKVKSIMGHSSGKGSMTERYTNFLPEHFDDIADLQEKLLISFGVK